MSSNISPSRQKNLWHWERHHYDQLSERGKLRYQAMLAKIGGKLLAHHPIKIPLSQQPFWLMWDQAMSPRFSLSPSPMPMQADIVIIGCGLTGSSAFYHLKESGLTVMLLEEADYPCAQSSGKNGGNFQLLSESYIGSYDGIVAERKEILQKHFPHLSKTRLQAHAEQDSRCILDFTMHNVERMTDMIHRESIECDFSPAGWLQLAASEHEVQAMMADEKLIPRDMERTSSVAMVHKLGLAQSPPFPGRWVFRSGNYHPVKFVHGLMSGTLRQPGKAFYPGTKVLSLRARKQGVDVHTNRHTIHATKVIVATNAFTPFVLPELKEIITCTPSQIINIEHVQQQLKGATVTEHEGEIYYNFPLSTVYQQQGKTYGMLHYGYDLEQEASDPYHIRRSTARFHQMMNQIHERFPATRGQPPSRCWSGPLGMTSDRTPVIGFLKPHVIVGAAFNGFGGSWCVQTGYVTAEMARTGHEHPQAPRTIFSPRRFFGRPEEWRP